MSKHHLPGHWRRLTTSCANALMTRAPTGTPPPTQPACDHAARPCLNLCGWVQVKSRTQCTDRARGASVAEPRAAPTVDLQCKRCKRGYRRLPHTLRIAVAMTNAAKFSQWIPQHGEASWEFGDFGFKYPHTHMRAPHAAGEHTQNLTFSTLEFESLQLTGTALGYCTV